MNLLRIAFYRSERVVAALGRSRAFRIVLAISFLFFFLPAQPAPAGEEKNALPRAEDVLKKSLERAKSSEGQRLDERYAYTSRTTIDQLDAKENLKRHEERVHYVFPVDGALYSRLVQKDGKLLSDRDAKHEQEREQKFRQELLQRKLKKDPGKPKDDEIELNEELVNKYRFEVVAREPVNGRPAIVLRLEPKSHDLPVRRKLDRLLNKLAGKVWIDEQDYEISRADLHLAESVTAWGGMLASIRKFALRIEQTRLDGQVWLPAVVDAYIDGRILVKSLHLKFVQHNSEFRKVSPSTTTGAAHDSGAGRLVHPTGLHRE